MTEPTPPGMYPDPTNNGQMRYFDGQSWAPIGQGPPKEKKAIWKRWWFLGGAGVLVLFVIAAAAGSGMEPEAQPAAQQTQAAPVQPAPSQAAPVASAPAPAPVEPAPAPAPVEPAPAPEPVEPEYTTAQQNAIEAAENYLSFTAFSKQGLIDQLSSEFGDGYSVADATFAVGTLTVDWNEQAYKKGQEYLDFTAFSRAGLIEQLTSSAGDKFTQAQATYAVNKLGL